MINFTDSARRHVVSYIEQETEDLAVRIEVLDSSPLAPRYDLALITDAERAPDDQSYDVDGFRVVVPTGSVELLDGATVDWVESMAGSGFKVDSPNLRPIGTEAPSGDLADRVRHVIDTEINPGIAAHGGSVSLVDVRDSVVYLKMSGGCQGCGMASVTLSQGIRRILGEAIPEITDIQDVTNHAAGANPYY